MTHARITWLRQLPDGYRQIAIKDCSEATKYATEESMSQAVMGLCDWAKTVVGYDFYDQLTSHYEMLEMLPDIFPFKRLRKYLADKYAPLPNLPDIL